MKKFRVLLGVLLAAPSLAHALGLGDIRLSSSLNQPLAADIELVGVVGEELSQLSASLASREAFVRYGLDRPPFLTTLTFRVGKDSAGRDVLQMRSPEPITEPFVTLLVEVAWPRGRLIREYTVLLDPPTFEAKASPTPAVEAPRTGVSEGAAAGAVVRSEAPGEPAGAQPVDAPSASPAAANGAPTAAVGGEYKVVRRDTLSLIAERAGAHTPADLNRLMIATFRANPAAFDGNINRLHRGAVLTIPGSDEWQSVPTKDANREVRRQMSEWRGQQGARAGGAEEARLRLVPPKEPAAGAGGGAAAAEAARAAKAAKEAEESKRLKFESEQLAKLQDANKARAAAAAAAAAAKPPAVTAPAAAVQPPATAAVPPAPTPTPVKAATAPKAAAAAPKTEKGLLELLTDNLLYVSLAGAAVLLALLAGFNVVRRRRQQADLDQSFRREAESEPEVAPEPAPRATRSAPARDAFVVEESPERTSEFAATSPPAPPRAQAAAPAASSKGALDDTLSSETAINLDQADPLAEADFHMAYGLYDQAADIVKLAIEREPTRRDLKLKLLEVYFVWGNRDSFLEVARELGRSRDQAAAGEWDKVVIMGRQIAADDALFAGSGALSAAADVDLDLEAGGAQGVDLELLGDAPADGDGIHLDLGNALAATDGGEETGDVPTLDPERFDLLLGRNRGGATAATTTKMRPGDAPTVEQPMIATQTRIDAPTVESPALRTQTRLDAPTIEAPGLAARGRADSPTVETQALTTRTRVDAPTVETPALAARGRGDSPTVESPALKSKVEQTIREKAPSAGRGERTPADATAELSLDDLGFELDKLAASSVSLQALSDTEHPADSPTVLADVNARSKSLLDAAGSRLDETRETPRLKLPPEERTARLPAMEPKPAEAPKAAAPKPAAPKPADPKPAAAKPVEAKPPPAKPPEAKPAEAKKKAAAPANGAAGSGETSIVKALDADDLDLDLGELARALENDTVEQRSRDEMHFSTDVFATGVHQKPPGLVDIDVGASLKEQHEPTVTERISVDELSMPELEPVTLSEVGTKLDLARAYMDMGDPDGARSILKEVLTEGSASQKQEAQRLIDTLPG